MQPLNFRYYCQKVLPAVYDESLSYYELLCKLTAKINEIINNDNHQSEDLQKLTDYVTHYFDNLDVQKEINTKLDAMAQSGQLSSIISQFLTTVNIFAYQTKTELKAAEHLAAGLYARTMGAETYTDGQGSYYYIRTKTQGDEPDDDVILALTNFANLVAEKIPDATLDDIESRVGVVEGHVDELTELVHAPTGSLTDLLTPAIDIVHAVNQHTTGLNTLQTEMTTNFADLTDKIGTLSDLNTIDDNSIVGAINEVNTKRIGIASGGTGADNTIDARRNLGVLGEHILFEGPATNGNIDFAPKLAEYGTNQLNKYKYLQFFAYMNTDESETDDGCISVTVYNSDLNSGYFNNRINISSQASTVTNQNKHYFKFAHACYDVGTPSNPNKAMLVTTNGKTAILSYNDQDHEIGWDVTWDTSNIYIYRVVGYL